MCHTCRKCPDSVFRARMLLVVSVTSLCLLTSYSLVSTEAVSLGLLLWLRAWCVRLWRRRPAAARLRSVLQPLSVTPPPSLPSFLPFHFLLPPFLISPLLSVFSHC